MKESQEHWWNGTESGKQKYWETNLSNLPFFHRKSHDECQYRAVNTLPLCYKNQLVNAL